MGSVPVVNSHASAVLTWASTCWAVGERWWGFVSVAFYPRLSFCLLFLCSYYSSSLLSLSSLFPLLSSSLPVAIAKLIVAVTISFVGFHLASAPSFCSPDHPPSKYYVSPHRCPTAVPNRPKFQPQYLQPFPPCFLHILEKNLLNPLQNRVLGKGTYQYRLHRSHFKG